MRNRTEAVNQLREQQRYRHRLSHQGRRQRRLQAVSGSELVFLARGVHRDDGMMGQDEIFNCSKSGVNNAILAKVNEFHGRVSDKSYSLWLDNG
jgi:hypothetical protein